ncbi:hypothetical protein [Candidatus Parabeggiatoa sp. HSG14]|uniref:hypothetical protein n=1 Tax=Candidatus Parabeggiatoa sp. HSG14 TaxID=3055593 RepID=UPI0025A85842|nr:hypothetical protein [Thiotrichales bacterium HSG14]
MNFVNDFFLHSVLAALVATVFFSLPGLWVLRLLGLTRKLHSLSVLLVIPALGLCTYGPFSLAFTMLFGYSTLTLIVAWVLFQAVILVWLRQDANLTKNTEDFCILSNKQSLFLLVGAAAWSIIPTTNIFPALYQGGLFVNDVIFDHAKVAIVDAIARDGLLPINPYYAPNGETIPLIYYYSWHFLASQLKLLTSVTGWQAEVAFNWFTGFATIAFLCAIAIRITQKAIAGTVLLLLALTGPPADLLLSVLGPRWANWVGYPPVHNLELLWMQMSWVPQHVFSALAIVVLIFLITRVLNNKELQFNYAVVAGLSAAAGFGASTWVGGIGLVFLLPALVIMAFWLRLPHDHYVNTLQTAILAIMIAGLFAAPLFASQLSGPSLTESTLPFGLGLYTATSLFNKEPYWGYIGHIILFWVQFLPLNLGIVFILGSFSVFLRSSRIPEERAFQFLSIAGIFGFLLIVQFIQSTFWNNSFGWRVVLVPVMLLLVWSAIALTELATCSEQKVVKWRQSAVRLRQVVLLVTTVGLTIGILGFARLWQLPDPTYRAPDANTLALHQGFLRQREAWAKVREYAGPSERVQSNPDGYAALTPWPATLPYALFADRATAFANVEYATVFAYRYDHDQRTEQYRIIQNVFSAQPTEQALHTIRDILKVKVLLVDKFDAVWSIDTIERSGIYDLVYTESDFRIYVASKIH